MYSLEATLLNVLNALNAVCRWWRGIGPRIEFIIVFKRDMSHAMGWYMPIIKAPTLPIDRDVPTLGIYVSTLHENTTHGFRP